jgi:hypothetical protein
MKRYSPIRVPFASIGGSLSKLCRVATAGAIPNIVGRHKGSPYSCND